ncbi:MAG: EamA family transporter [Desulfobacca sp.]|nr:EamA family transporter [Desulfobacca sp.]
MMTKTLLTLIIAIISVSIGDVLLSRGMKQIGAVSSCHPRELLKLGMQIFSHPTIIVGILCLAVFFFLWLAVLSWSDLSFALPLTALSYVVTAFLAQYLLQEDITPIRWAGTVLICMGVALVTKSGY